MANDLEEENGGCSTKMANLRKRLKECRDRRVDPNKNMEESNKKSLLSQHSFSLFFRLAILVPQPPFSPYKSFVISF